MPGSLKECMQAVELVKAGKVRLKVFLRWSKNLSKGHEKLERRDIAGTRIGDDPGTMLRN
jgi:hypothetical protein